MRNDFHCREFDEGTKLKLAVFRGYIREWISLWASGSDRLNHISMINVFDLFCGPGTDVSGNSGSPAIILEEISSLDVLRGKEKRPHIRAYFNDEAVDKIVNLQDMLSARWSDSDRASVRVSASPFAEVLEEYLPVICRADTANLVIMDQCGISDVNQEFVRCLARCIGTDILFFVPSSFVYRFRNHPAFTDKIDVGRNAEYNTIHRYICEYYKELLPDREYYFSPFSIKDNGRIHGVVFGSGNLRGLEKFLAVCWDLDPTTGEANYPVDGDPSWYGQGYLLEDMNGIKKIDLFRRDIEEYIGCAEPDNLQMYRFVLTKGFTPRKARELLRNLQKFGRIEVVSLAGMKPRMGDYYLNYSEKTAKIRFRKVPGAS